MNFIPVKLKSLRKITAHMREQSYILRVSRRTETYRKLGYAPVRVVHELRYGDEEVIIVHDENLLFSDCDHEEFYDLNMAKKIRKDLGELGFVLVKCD